jgi:hypothetical protein
MWISSFLAAPLVVEPVLETGVLHLDARRRRKFNILRHWRFPKSERNGHHVHGTLSNTCCTYTNVTLHPLSNHLGSCVAIRDPDPGCLSRIPDPNFFHPGSWIQGQKDSRIPNNTFQPINYSHFCYFIWYRMYREEKSYR